jgi:hypothetical protein
MRPLKYKIYGLNQPKNPKESRRKSTNSTLFLSNISSQVSLISS